MHACGWWGGGGGGGVEVVGGESPRQAGSRGHLCRRWASLFKQRDRCKSLLRSVLRAPSSTHLNVNKCFMAESVNRLFAFVVLCTRRVHPRVALVVVRRKATPP